jgi:hypothetical protein
MDKKKALFIGIGFYDYDQIIIDELKKLNFDVDYFSEVPPENFKYKFYTKIFNRKKLQVIKSEYSNSIVKQTGNNYDFVFIIKCENLSIENIKTFKEKSPKSKFVLYLWDSISRIDGIVDKFNLFDKIYSFDRFDCLSNTNLIFHPLFFRVEYNIAENENKNLVYDIYHLGWYHSDRLQLIKKIAIFFDANNLNNKLLLYTGLFSYLYQSIFGGQLKGNKKYLTFKPISAADNIVNIKKAKSILDIAHPMQTGLTMRTIEMVGMQKKIITTNSDIINYEFYHPNNILIIDREIPTLDLSFLESDYCQISFEIREKYSISNWLIKMIN